MVHLTNWLILLSLTSTPGKPAGGNLSFGIIAVVPIPTDLRQGATDPHGYAVQGTSHPVISESVVQATLVSDEPQVTISTFLAKAWGSLPSWRVVTGDPLLPQHGWVRCLVDP